MMSDDSREFLHGVARELYLKNPTVDPNEFLNALENDALLFQFLERWEYPVQLTPELEEFANQYGETLRPPAPLQRHTRRKRAA
jgi:hypothetical protein